MSKQILEKGLVPEVGNIDANPITLTDKTLVALLGSTAPDAGLFGDSTGLYEMLNVIAAHQHKGVAGDVAKVLHSDLDFTGDTMHDTKPHGASAHTTGAIGTLYQITGLEAANQTLVNATNLIKVMDGSDATGLHAHPHALSSATHSGSLPEASVTFGTTVGHDHTGATGHGKKIAVADLYSVSANVTATNLNALTGGASTSLHKHDPNTMVSVVKEFGFSPEYPNIVFDSEGLLATNGTFVGGFDATNMHSYLQWSSPLPAMQSYRVRLMVKLPSDFKAWNDTLAVRFWHQETYVDAADVSLDMKVSLPNGTPAAIVPSSLSLGTSAAWTEFDITGVSGATYHANDWIVVTFAVGAKNAAAVRLGRIDFRYNTKDS